VGVAATCLALVVLLDGEGAEPVGLGAVGGGGVLLHGAEDVSRPWRRAREGLLPGDARERAFSSQQR